MTGTEMDFVISWVNGLDEDWLARRARAGNKDLATSGDARNRREGYLRYQLRSIAECAPWVRKIYLVTETRLPAWLRTDHSKLVVLADSAINPTGAETFNSHAVEASLCNIPGLADRFVYFNDDFFIGRPVDPDFYFPGGFAYANPLPSYIATRDMHAHGMLNAVGAINENFTRKEYFTGLARGFRRRMISDGVRLPLTFTSKRIPPIGDVHLPTPLVTDLVREAFRADAARIEETQRSVFRSATDVAPIYLAMMWHVARGEFTPVSKRTLGAFMSLEGNDPAAEFTKLLAGNPAQFCINDNVRVDDPQLEDALRDALERRWPDPSPFERDGC